MNEAAATTAVVAHQGDFTPRAVINLGDYDRARYNVLIPGAFTVQMTPFLVPVVREYALDPEPDHGEVYVQEWTKQGDRFVPKFLGINALGLANLANVAGILEIPQASGRVDDGRDAGVCTYRSTMFMRLPDGQPVIRTRELTLELATLFDEVTQTVTKKGTEHKYNGRADPWKPERIASEIAKQQMLARKFFHRKCETGAKARTHRVMLGIRSKYTPAEIARPFVLAAVVPDVNQPEIRERMLDQATSSIGMVFGGAEVARPARQLAAGAAPEPAADDIAQAAADGASVGAKPTAEELAELAGGAGLDPDLAGDDGGADDAAEDPGGVADDGTVAGGVPDWAKPTGAATKAAPAQLSFVDRLKDGARRSRRGGAADDDQREYLRSILGNLDWERESLPILVAAFGPRAATSLSAAQAESIATAADEYKSPEEFCAAWKIASGERAS